MNDKKRYPLLPEAGNISKLCVDKMVKMYGMPIPDIINDRAMQELWAIIQNDNETIYMTAKYLVDKVRESGKPIGTRGSIGSSFVAFLLGFTDINPLSPHYYCRKCKYIEFIPEVISGFDLPEKICPQCGLSITGDGHDIPFESFGGIHGEKAPDIDLNFPGDISMKGEELLKEIFPNDMIVRAGWRFEKTNQMQLHPGGWMIIPREYAKDVPVEYIGANRDRAVTARDYRDLTDLYYKQDILGYSALDRLHSLTKETGVPLENIPMNNDNDLQAFSRGNTQGIIGFGSECVLKMLKKLKPVCFSDLVKISGLSGGTEVWLNNAEVLLQNGSATLQDVIAFRDDIFNLLFSRGMERKAAYEIMEMVRKGKGMNLSDDTFSGIDIPDWYLDSCRIIKYLLPKAHAVSYVKIAVQMMWFKLHHSEIFNKILAEESDRNKNEI